MPSLDFIKEKKEILVYQWIKVASASTTRIRFCSLIVFSF